MSSAQTSKGKNVKLACKVFCFAQYARGERPDTETKRSGVEVKAARRQAKKKDVKLACKVFCFAQYARGERPDTETKRSGVEVRAARRQAKEKDVKLACIVFRCDAFNEIDIAPQMSAEN